MKIILLICLFYILLGCATSKKHSEIENAINYLNQKLNTTFTFEELDLKTFSQALSVIGPHLKSDMKIDRAQKKLVENFITAVSIRNSVLKSKGQIIDNEQVEKTLFLIENILLNTPIKSKVTHIAYNAVFLAREHSLNEKRELDFLIFCAANGHAGCANVMAHNYQYGVNGLKVNLLQAINWNTVAYNSGISYGCAGIYSANNLGDITFIAPELDPVYNWQTWYEKANQLLELQKNKYKSSAGNVCREPKLKTNQYLYFLAIKQSRTDLLNEASDALNKESKGPYYDAYKLIGKPYSLSQLLSLTEQIKNEYSLCEIYELHAFYLMIINRKKDAEFLIEKMHNLDKKICKPAIDELRIKENKISTK